ncbi:hypothetical protein RI129_008870 [Pyrocoelia pectoralis]|uniref:MADF domain-containing protein n=1 Tax=Pyrocoelia pectoralis TaxID=417401 RepID=A0AAN7V9E5_9COLE
MDAFDTDTFISEIKNYCCIWDYKCESYSNKIEKNNAWADICRKFTTNFEEKSVKEKNDIAKALQRKWKTLRDGFNREVKKNKSTKSGSAASAKRQYVFFHQLSFLLPLVEARAETTNSLTDTASQNNEDEKNSEPPKSHPQKLKRKSVQSSEDKLIETLPQRIAKKINNGNEDSDDDKYFLLSLHNDLKHIPEELKLDAKAEILGVLKKFKAIASPISTQFSFTSIPRNPYHHTNHPLYYDTNLMQIPPSPINHPSTSGQIRLISPQDSARSNSSFEDVF